MGLQLYDDRNRTECDILNSLVQYTDGYTGADIKGVLNEVQLVAVNKALAQLGTEESSSGDLNDSEHDFLKIHYDQMLKVLASFRPSISASDKRNLERLYSQFTDSKKDIKRDLQKRVAHQQYMILGLQ